MKWQILWSTLGKNRKTKRRLIQQNQPTGNLLDGKSRWVQTLYSPSNTSIYRTRRNRIAKKRDWNTERRKEQTKTCYGWEKYINETSDWNIKQRKGLIETRQTSQNISTPILKHQSSQNIPLDTRNRFVLLQNI